MGGNASKAATEAASVTRRYPAAAPAPPSPAPAPAPAAVRPSPAQATPPPPPPDNPDQLTPEEEAAVERDVRDMRVGHSLAGLKFENVGRAVQPEQFVRKDNELMDVVRGRAARSRRLQNPYLNPPSAGTAPGTAPDAGAPAPRKRLLVTEVEDLVGITTRRRLARGEWTPEQAGARYGIAGRDVEALLRYLNAPTVEQGKEEGKLEGWWTEPDEKGRMARPKG